MSKTNEATRFKPKPPGEKMVRTQVHIRPDQAARLALEGNQSEVIRRALDQYFTVHAPPSGEKEGRHDLRIKSTVPLRDMRQ